jgi:hypothetical protein
MVGSGRRGVARQHTAGNKVTAASSSPTSSYGTREVSSSPGDESGVAIQTGGLTATTENAMTQNNESLAFDRSDKSPLRFQSSVVCAESDRPMANLDIISELWHVESLNPSSFRAASREHASPRDSPVERTLYIGYEPQLAVSLPYFGPNPTYTRGGGKRAPRGQGDK